MNTTTAPAAVIALTEINTAAVTLGLSCEVCLPQALVLVDEDGDWSLEASHDTDCPASRWSQRHTEGGCCADR